MTSLTPSHAQAIAQAQSYQSQGAMNVAQSYQSQMSAMNAAASHYQFAHSRGDSRNMQNTGKITGDVYPPATSMELDHPAYEAPVSVLIDMWLVRFGNDWIDIEAVDNDNFFRLAFKRLKAMGELEVHYLTDRARYVCRKPK